jgi:hypothetical protein
MSCVGISVRNDHSNRVHARISRTCQPIGADAAHRAGAACEAGSRLGAGADHLSQWLRRCGFMPAVAASTQRREEMAPKVEWYYHRNG